MNTITITQIRTISRLSYYPPPKNDNLDMISSKEGIPKMTQYKQKSKHFSSVKS